MENEIKMNILEILKKCPIGTKLYSTLCGKCKLHNVLDNTFNIISGKTIFTFLHDGRYKSGGEVCIFPSKKNRDWNKFKVSFENGDIISDSSSICIFKKEGNLNGTVDFYCGIGWNGKFLIKDINYPNHHFGNIIDYKLATEEEKERLFVQIENNGYKWNSQTKTLEKLIKDKFDISTLIPFKSKVLVRDSENQFWKAAIFGGYINDSPDDFKYIVMGETFYKCLIPYKNNEHLLCTKNDCEKYYKTW